MRVRAAVRLSLAKQELAPNHAIERGRVQHVHEVRHWVALVEHVEGDYLHALDQFALGRVLRAEPALGELLLDDAPLERRIRVTSRGLTGPGAGILAGSRHAEAENGGSQERSHKRKAEPAVQVYPKLG